jgi:hypothetical protein
MMLAIDNVLNNTPQLRNWYIYRSVNLFYTGNGKEDVILFIYSAHVQTYTQSFYSILETAL